MDREARRALLLTMSDFHRCPTTGRVIEGMKGDDKVVCGCGKSSPKVRESIQGVVHHIKRCMEPATVDEYLDQEYRERGLL